MIPLWAISAIGAGAVAGLAGYGLASRLGDAKLARAEAGWDQERASASAAAASASEAYRSLESRARDERDKSEGIARDHITKLQGALAAERRSGIGLRSQFAAFVANSTVAAEGAATEFQRHAARAAGDLQILVLERIDSAAGVIAEHADRSRIAGLACEREHAIAVTP